MDEDSRYLRLSRSPDAEEEVKDLKLRANKQDRDMCARLRLFQSMCIERVRESNPWAANYHKAFDREIYLGQGTEVVPEELIAYTRTYMKSLPAIVDADTPMPAGSTMYDFLKAKLNALLGLKTLDPQCYRMAKTFTAFAGRVARNLFRTEGSPVEPAYAWRHLQTLQEYQCRQLVEQSLFSEADGDYQADHSISRFVGWIRQMGDVQQMQDDVNKKQAWFKADPVKMELDSAWAARVEKANNLGECEHVDKVVRFQMMLTPALEMAQAMGYCSTPCQKVRLWAEAILEAISLINMQIAGGGEGQIGGPDVPSIVLFLTCVNECDDMVVQAKLARLFCLDNYGMDQREYKLPDGGLYSDMADQYAFAAEERAIDHSHYLLWVEDTLRIIAEEGA